MRSGPRVPLRVSLPGVPRSSATPGCTTIPAGREPGSDTTSRRPRENALTSERVAFPRFAT
jgi:hypothetical protein